MNIYLSIDDTDNLDTPGSGQLAELMAQELMQNKFVHNNSSISRHQLHVHEDIPYTSHNSSMCFTAVTPQEKINALIEYSSRFLAEHSAEGSDPGLCIAIDDDSLDRASLINFGLAAKKNILLKSDAYSLAEKMGVHLSEHGGTGDGVIGALAGIGLRMSGHDGRFRGWLHCDANGQTVTASQLLQLDKAEAVVDLEGNTLPNHSAVSITSEMIKTVCYDHRQVIPVKRYNGNDELWATLTKKESKQF